MGLTATGSQTVGPFFHIGLAPMFVTEVAGSAEQGERVTIRGQVFDGDGAPVPDAILETWQADANGRYVNPGDAGLEVGPHQLIGFGRVPTDEAGQFTLTTFRPGCVPGPGDTLQAPHLVVLVFMRGLLRHLVTRMYFPDDPSNETDPILRLVPAERQHTLIARSATPAGNVLIWNLVMQGEQETVFFDA